MQINVAATFQGQAATATTQTKVPTNPLTSAAQSGGSAAAQDAAAGAAAGADSGGVSGAVIGGVVVAGAAGGFFAARELIKKDEALQLPRVFSIPYSAQGALVMSRAGFPSCSAPYAESGSVEIC